MLQRNTLSSLHLFWEASRSPVTQLGLSNALSEGALFPPDSFSSPPLEPGLHWVNFSLFAHYKKKKIFFFFFCWVAFNPSPPLAAAKLYRSIKGQPNYGKCSEHLFLEVPALLFAGLGGTFDTCQLPPLLYLHSRVRKKQSCTRWFPCTYSQCATLCNNNKTFTHCWGSSHL